MRVQNVLSSGILRLRGYFQMMVNEAPSVPKQWTPRRTR
uniref:Uncharacterized protein n=1 Tax=Rhizophora mucronata TaxID=61149 RepID=A0A2P2QEV9_RHIMU